MKLSLTARALLSGALAAAALAPITVSAADSGRSGGLDARPAIEVTRSLATFEGRTIDLSKDWDGAQACHLDGSGDITCYRSEAELRRAVPQAVSTSSADRHGVRAAYCSTSLRVYRNNSYSGGLVYISQRWTWINLSWFGFDNTVSSYRVGSCSATFRSGSYGTGSTYGGGTWAWAARSSMPGWNNVLSSVRLS